MRRLTALALAATLALAAPLALVPAPGAFAADAPQPESVKNVAAAPGDINLDNDRGLTSVLMGHDMLVPPVLNNVELTVGQNPPGAYLGRAVRYFFDAYNKGYTGKAPVAVYDDVRDRLDWTADKFRIDNLPSGTIYDITASTYNRFRDIVNGIPSQTIKNSPLSTPSDIFRMYTGTQLDAALIAPDQIRLSWDDVWYNDRRIYAYDLNVYTSSASNNPERTIRFTDNLIGPGQPVSVNQMSGKLEYTYTVPYPGRVYCFEVVPVMSNVPDVVVPERNARVTVASTILVNATKLYEGENTITWEIKWSNVTAGMGAVSSSIYTAEYSLFKHGGGSLYTLLQRIENETSTIIETPKDPEHPDNLNATYEISARVFEDGREMYIGESIYITSGPFALREGEPPFKPQAPNLMLYEQTITEDSAGLWWSIPRLVTDPGVNDEDVDYEIYVLDDPGQLNNLTASPTFFMSGRALGKGDYEGVEGYIYNISGLLPNTTYYLAVRAVKTFLDLETMSIIRIPSELSYVIATTLPKLPVGQPPAPTTLDIYKERIKHDSVTLKVKTAWYESFDAELGEWVPCDPKYNTAGMPLPEGPDYRKLSYEPGDKMIVYYALYDESMNLDDPDSFSYDSYVVFDITRFDTDVWMDLLIDGLSDNTTYVFWAKADRDTVLSFTSKAIAATTPPIPNIDISPPRVPDFDFLYIGDTYIDLTFMAEEGHTYNIQYSLSNDPDDTSSQTTIVATAEEIYEAGYNFYRVTGLTPDTLYYFRIQAQAQSPVSGDILSSVWSDFKPARTKPPMPPATPAGFGVKSTSDAIKKDSIFYEWHIMPGIEYVLEYSQDSQMEISTMIRVGSVSEYNLTGLLSNHRYYARLYAYDPATGLYSEPTYIVGVRTRRSGDEYDSNVDNTTVLSGDFVEMDEYVENGIWNVRIVGTNADRFAERVMTDKMLDYVVDLSKPPRHAEKISFVAENLVFDSLDKMLENLELKLADKTFIIRPRMLSPSLAGGAARRLAKFRYEILIGFGGNENYEETGDYRLKTTMTSFDVNVLDGNMKYPMGTFGKPLKIVVPFSSPSFYRDGTTGGIASSRAGRWEKLPVAVSFDNDTRRGAASFEYAGPGNFALADSSGSGITDNGGNRYRQYVNRLAIAGLLEVPPGGAFRADDPASPEEAVAMLFKAFGYKYDGNYMDAAFKAGFVSAAGLGDMLIEEAVAMTVRAYEVRTGIKAGPAPEDAALTPGVSAVSPQMRGRVQFAADNGILEPILAANSGAFPAGQTVTKGEMAAIIAVTLEFLGVL